MTKSIYNLVFKQLLFKSFLALCILATFLSCERDEAPITDTSRYSFDEIKSYEDLFTVFWTVMDNDYNYFNEEKIRNGLDWDEVYAEYLPKFQALKTWWGTDAFNAATNSQIVEESDMAKEYFAEILEQLIDKHYVLGVNLPDSRTSRVWFGFRTGSRDEVSPLIYNKLPTMNNVSGKLDDSFYYFDADRPTVLSGALNSNPDIHYFSFNFFGLFSYKITLDSQDLLFNDPANPSGLTRSGLESNDDLNGIQDPEIRNAVRDWTLKVYDAWYEALTNSLWSSEFNKEAATFESTEEVSDLLISEATRLQDAINNLPKGFFTSLENNLLSPTELTILNSTKALQYMGNFDRNMERMKNSYNFSRYSTAIEQVIAAGPLYQTFFNPLTRGEIKKLILDLRGNGGGAVVDARFFTERLITKEALVMYQRTKEGSGRYNYTPWVPVYTRPHAYGMPNNIPIVVLTDKGSVSMSETSTFALQSQGDQVKVVGDYSLGGTAGLGDPDAFNGGFSSFDEIIGGSLRLRMPLMATKDASGKVIEAIGIEPDVYVTPPTQEEVNDMNTNPNHVDRALEKAIEVLTSM